jgi:hypothetical protein
MNNWVEYGRACLMSPSLNFDSYCWLRTQHVWGFCFSLQVLIIKTHKSNNNLINIKLTKIQKNKNWPSNSSQNVISHGLRMSFILVWVPTPWLDHSCSFKKIWNLFHEMHQIYRGHLCQNPKYLTHGFHVDNTKNWHKIKSFLSRQHDHKMKMN